MSLLDQIGSMLGGTQQVERIANGQANLHDPGSPDAQAVQQMANAAPPQLTQEAFAQAAQQVDPQQYREHVTPGAGGTDPLGGLGQGALGFLGGSLVSSLAGAIGGGGLSQLTQLVPGLSTTNPQQMSPQDVASLASYMQQHHPQAFGQAAAQVAQQQPDLLHQLMGNKALMLGAAALGIKILQDRAQGRTF